jgi:hypothetical protein
VPKVIGESFFMSEVLRAFLSKMETDKNTPRYSSSWSWELQVLFLEGVLLKAFILPKVPNFTKTILISFRIDWAIQLN